MTDFLTVEDLNSVRINFGRSYFWHEIPIDIGSDAEFDGLMFDFLEVDRTLSNNQYEFKITILNDDCITGYFLNGNDEYITSASVSGNVVTLTSDTPIITCMLHVAFNYLSFGFTIVDWVISTVSSNINDNTGNPIVLGVEAVNPNFNPNGKTFKCVVNNQTINVECVDNKLTINNVGSRVRVSYNNKGNITIPYPSFFDVLVIIPVFDSLVIGEINSLTFKTDRNISLSAVEVKCDYPVLDVKQGTSSDEFIVDLDLRKLRTLKPVTLKIDTFHGAEYYYSDDVFIFGTGYSTITSIADFNSLCTTGGYAELGANLTLTSDVTLGGDVTIIGENHTLDFNEHNITVPEGVSLKIENTNISNGVNTFKQEEGSTVELTNCSFTDCISSEGVGGVIDCNVDIDSLDNSDDFTTTILNTTFDNCDCPILHGGDLTVQNCQITGKLSNPTFPYFLYQTDGNAHINRNQFSITGGSDEDIQFNSCIFTCGEKARINGLDHRDLQKNDIKSFLEENSSTIDVSYYYAPIDNDVTITGGGFCHSVSGIAKIYKTQVTITRGE